MIVSFGDKITEDIFNGKTTSKTKKYTNISAIICRKLDMINSSSQIKDLNSPPANHLNPSLPYRHFK